MQISMVFHCFLVVLLLSLHQVPIFAAPKHYIVYLGSHHAEPRLLASPEKVTNSHHELISSLSMSGDSPSERMVYSYNKIFNGFAALLHEEEANELARHPKVASVFESQYLKLATTRSPDFLELSTPLHKEASRFNESLWEKTSFGDDIIIAGIDTGIWPESESFSDEGIGPIPKRFKGRCENQNDPKFKCNRKLIGARCFQKGMVEDARVNNSTFNATLSPRDDVSHGTHTLSTAGGNFVPGATCLGVANGTARGMAPKARIVSYKALWNTPSGATTGTDADFLAAFEAAIDDAVDIINFSAGAVKIQSYFDDAISLATFHAMKNGILTVCAGGNSGPALGTISNVAPWVLTVAASTSDRGIYSDLVLGNNQKIKSSRFLDAPSHDPNKLYPLITGVDARIPRANINDASTCRAGSLDVAKVKGKIVVCHNIAKEGDEETEKSMALQEAGAIGMILANEKNLESETNPGAIHWLTTSTISHNDSKTLFAYINSTRTPVASISQITTLLGIKPSPIMATFSSRGPNGITPSILKPDVTAPGVNILAAYLPDIYNTPFYLESGTSMAAPHVAGIAALIKKLHPDWSTAAIKSAIMTTATPLDNTMMPILDYDKVRKASPFAYGAGHVKPNLATNPGLVYDMNHHDYIDFLCTTSYNTTLLDNFAKQHSYKCPQSFSILDFNYPSITIPDFTGDAVVTRKLKNVGQPGTYVARVEAPHGVSIVVQPKTLVFSAKNQEIQFKLIVTADVNQLPNEYVFGSLLWSDAVHIVRSPITVKAKKD